MQRIKGALRKLRERPFDFYAAFAIFIAGAYALFSPAWPEPTEIPEINILINIVSLYMMIASALVMSALLCNRKAKPIYAILAEMWGWLAICAASFAVSLIYLAKIIYAGSDNFFAGIVLMLVWFGMCVASGFRSLDIHIILRGIR